MTFLVGSPAGSLVGSLVNSIVRSLAGSLVSSLVGHPGSYPVLTQAHHCAVTYEAIARLLKPQKCVPWIA